MYWSILRKSLLTPLLFHCICSFSQMDELQLRDLRGDTLLALEEYKAPILVLVFDQFNCPYVKEYKARMDSITRYYSKKGVQFVYINSDADDFKKPDYKKLAQNRYNHLLANIPYIADRYAKYMYTLNIRKAPEVCVLTKSFDRYTSVYIGGIDDSPLSEADVRNAYLKTTLDQLLTGKRLKPTQQPTIGCMIKRD